jgi:hypothetical protein
VFEYWRIWIDYNGDLDFEDPGELVYTGSKLKTAVSPTINVSSVTMVTRMRVAMKRGSVPLPCETFSNGEVEDYQVSIKSGSPGFRDINAEMLDDSGMVIYPNPANGILNIQLAGMSGRTELAIYTVLGAKIFDHWLETDYYQQDISGLKTGIYFLVVRDGTRSHSAKFVKQ